MEQHREQDYLLVDTHAHLTWHSFNDVPEVMARARAAGMDRLLSVATDLESSRAAIDLAASYPEAYAAVGIHPNDVRADDDLQLLAALAREPRVVAIGETGLDYYRDHTEPSLQRRSFAAHLALAIERNLPVVVHNRAADSDVLEALTAVQGQVRGVLHCFSGDMDLARQALELGFYLSFAGNLTYPSARTLREIAATVPIDKVLIETDSPFLAPAPHRGRRNEPAYIALTLQVLAHMRDQDPASLSRQLATNAHALFGW